MLVPNFRELGASQQAITVAGGLAKRGFRFAIIALQDDGPLRHTFEALGIPAVCLDMRNRDFARMVFAIRKYIKNLKIDVVHSWGEETNSIASIATRMSKTEMIASCYNHRYRRTFADAIPGATIPSKVVLPHAAISDSDYLAGSSSNELEIIPNAEITTVASSITQARRGLLSKLKLMDADKPKILGTVSDLIPQARLKDLVWAMDLIKCVRDDVHLVIWGSGSYERNIRRFADAIEIRQHVHFVGANENIVDLLPGLDAYWHSHDLRPFDNGVMAAMSNHIPVVAARGPGMDALIGKDERGILVGLGAKDGFARATNVLIDDESKIKRLTKSAKTLLEAHFSSDEFVERFRELYQKVHVSYRQN